MPFSSQKQRRFMFSQHPDIAHRWTAEAKRDHTPLVAPDLDMGGLGRARAQVYHDADLTRDPETDLGRNPRQRAFDEGIRGVTAPANLAELAKMHPYVPAQNGMPAYVLGPFGYVPAATSPPPPNLPSPPVPPGMQVTGVAPAGPYAVAPVTNPRAGDLDLYRKQIADAYREMGKPAAKKYADAPGTIDLAMPGSIPIQPSPPPSPALTGGLPTATDVNLAPRVRSSPLITGAPTAEPGVMQLDALNRENEASTAGLPTPRDEEWKFAPYRDAKAIPQKKPADPSQLVHVTPASAPGSGTPVTSSGNYDTSLVPQAHTVAVPAREIPGMDPSRIAGLSQDQRSILDAQRDLADAEAHQAEDAGVSAALKGQKLQQQQEEMSAKAAERNAYLQTQEDRIRSLSDELATQKIDPWRGKGVGAKFAFSLAAALGEFAAIRGHGQNGALQMMNKQLDDEMASQRSAIEAKKGQIGDMQGILAASYRRFGNMDQAENAARAVALQQFDAEQQAYAAKSGSEASMARSRIVSGQLKLDADKYIDALYRYQPATVAQSGGLSSKQVEKLNETAASIYKDAATNGQVISPMEARRQAASLLGITSGSNYAPIAKVSGGGKPSQKDAENIRAHEEAIKNIDSLIAMRQKNNGGSFSPEDKRVASAMAARTQEQLVAALGKTNSQLLNRTSVLIPDDPLEHNASGIVGQDPTMAGLSAAKTMLQSELGRIQQTPGAPGSAGSDDVPVTPEE